MKSIRLALFALSNLVACLVHAAPLVFEGTSGPGKGKHIVFLAGDHEYRSEETLPALARIMAKEQGFKCTVLFNIDPANGEIVAGNSNMPGMEALDTADLAVVFLRFQAFPEEQMKHFDAYLNRGGPVVGLRTATHAFKMGEGAPFAKYSFNYKGADYQLGFGHQVLGQTWVGHYGTNHKQSTRITIAEGKQKNPILQGVKDVWVQAGAYVGKPTDGEILTVAQPLNGMTQDSPVDTTKPPQPSEWTRSYKSASGKTGRVFTSLYGTPEDITNEGYRRLLVNGMFWAVGLEKEIKPDLNISFVGPFKPNTFGDQKHAVGIKPEMYAGWDSPIPANNNVNTGKREPKANKADKKAPSAQAEPLKAASTPVATVAPAPAAETKADRKKKDKGGRTPAEPTKGMGPTSAEVPADYKDPLPFAFRKGDVVAILGNGLPDRMQHDGWMETLLQSQLAASLVRFRTMSISGDQPDLYPRSKGQMAMTEYLQVVKPNVIFGFFGYNESYTNKAEDYKKRLIEFVKNARAAKPDGKGFPRMVLFSPIAHEDTHNRNVPDGKAHNVQLEACTKATEEAAREAGVAFVDLFHPSLELFKAAKAPLTINGVHLSVEGDRQLAEVIAKGLLGKQVAASSSLEKLRQAVLDKDYHWYQRYHTADGNDVWGSRSTAGSVNGVNNGVVLKHELEMLDVMTANRDERIWALGGGHDKTVNDSNVPKPLVVGSNLSEGGKNAAKIGTIAYLSPEESLKRIAVAKGFKVELYADETRFPQLANPVQMQFDTKGRLWVAAWPSYPKWEPTKTWKDSLLIFEDDGHGHAKSVKEFAQVQNPLGFEFCNNGVIVTRQSELLYLKDTDGDDKADAQEIILQGLDTSDTHHGANNMVYGPDGAMYWQSGIFMQHNFESPWGPSLQSTASGMYRFDPRRSAISFHASNSPNSHGISFDNWGYHYATDGTSGRAFQVRLDPQGFKMYELLKKEVRPVPGHTVISSANFPESMQGDFLICNVIGFLGLKQYHLQRDGEKGTVWGEPSGEELTVKTLKDDGTMAEEKARGFLMSGDKNFRPTGAIFGPDGALYVSDWQNAIIGHLQHNVRDSNRDHIHGRIYRITAVDRPLQKQVAVAGQPIPALLENLKSPIDGIRHRTHIELSGRNSGEVIAETQKWMKQFNPDKKEDAHHLLEALWIHEQHNVANSGLLAEVLKSPEPNARNAAKVVAYLMSDEYRGAKSGVIKDEEDGKKQKSGIISDTAELTTIRIATIPEKLSYDVKELTVKAGKKIKLTFANPDFMPHNLLLLQPGKADEVGNQATALGAGGFANGFIPDNKNIIWHTKLIDHGSEEVIEFNAPATPGDYPYICSFPGHHLVMRGILHVK